MVSRISYIGFPVLGGVLLSIGLSACSDDTPATPAAETGGSIGTGGGSTGGAATGGKSGGGTGGGTAGAGGSTGGKAGGDSGPPPVDYVCSDAKPRDPGGTGADGASCCGGAGKCAAPSTVTGDAAKSLGHDTCGATLVCAPTATAKPTACTTNVGGNGLEGRCIPSCFMLGNPQSLTLDKGGVDGGTACGADELCAPCWNPVDGTSTGSCNTNGDAPTSTAPTPYAKCPAANDAGQPVGGGLCVPASALATAKDPKSPIYNPAINGLKKGSCAAGELCVPEAKAKDPTHCSPHCTTGSTVMALGTLYKNGACTPEYVIFDVAGASGIMFSSGGTGCSAGELCAPCQDPLNPGKPSGACY